MLLEVLLARTDELSSNELVSSLLESRHNVSDQSSLDAIWLDCDEANHIVSIGDRIVLIKVILKSKGRWLTSVLLTY